MRLEGCGVVISIPMKGALEEAIRRMSGDTWQRCRVPLAVLLGGIPAEAGPSFRRRNMDALRVGTRSQRQKHWPQRHGVRPTYRSNRRQRSRLGGRPPDQHRCMRVEAMAGLTVAATVPKNSVAACCHARPTPVVADGMEAVARSCVTCCRLPEDVARCHRFFRANQRCRVYRRTMGKRGRRGQACLQCQAASLRT